MYKKHFCFLILSTFVIIFTFLSVAYASAKGFFEANSNFTNEEMKWLKEHKNKRLKLGLTPFSGMDYFENEAQIQGYLMDIVSIFEEETGLKIEIDNKKSWGEAYNGLFDGSVDILFGANSTEERLKVMAFTEGVHRYPYTLLALKNGNIHTIGDLDKKNVGFIAGDIVIDVFRENYPNIHYKEYEYLNQYYALEAMINGEIDGFITSGGEIIYEYLYQYSQIKDIVQLKNVYSDMTFSTRIQDKILADILDKVIKNRKKDIKEAINKARTAYVRKILRLSKEEIDWLDNHSVIKVGVATDYLPIDYYENNRYTGIAGEFFTEFANLVGLKVQCVPGSFDSIYKKAFTGEIDVLNMAKTEDRESIFCFTDPFSNERDAIYGSKSSPVIYDIYGLEGKRVAVIEGFWHEEYLIKNLKDVKIVHTKDIMETVFLVKHKKVDYFLENPSVAEYYIQGLGYNDIVKKGETSADSFLYFGVNKEYIELVGVFNRAIKLIDFDKTKYRGIQNVPALKNVKNTQLVKILFVALVLLIIISIFLVRLFKELVAQKTETRILKEREHLIYTDALTELYNRLYYNSLKDKMGNYSYPQGFIIIDLNNLKVTNDNYGHQAGDRLLQTFAVILKELVPSESLMRMGGDEFLIFLPSCYEQQIEVLMEKIRLECRNASVILESGIRLKGPVPAIGYSIRYSNSISPEQALFEADQSMYLDKQHHKKAEAK